MVHQPTFFTVASTFARNFASSNTISGNRITCGASPGFSAARPPAAAVQPAWRPITSKMKTLVDVLAIDPRSNPASGFATGPTPGQGWVGGRSLSIVLGTWIA